MTLVAVLMGEVEYGAIDTRIVGPFETHEQARAWFEVTAPPYRLAGIVELESAAAVFIMEGQS